ncbi:MAG: hypothetical protein WA970_12925, partial [Gammaproteobacteria bacterium]
VVNAVSLYVEHGQETFHSVHVESAERVAVQAHQAGVELCVPKTSSALIGGGNHLTLADHDRVGLLHLVGGDRPVQVAEQA